MTVLVSLSGLRSDKTWPVAPVPIARTQYHRSKSSTIGSAVVLKSCLNDVSRPRPISTAPLQADVVDAYKITPSNLLVFDGLVQFRSMDLIPAVAARPCGSGTPGNPSTIVPSSVTVEYAPSAGSA